MHVRAIAQRKRTGQSRFVDRKRSFTQKKGTLSKSGLAAVDKKGVKKMYDLIPLQSLNT